MIGEQLNWPIIKALHNIQNFSVNNFFLILLSIFLFFSMCMLDLNIYPDDTAELILWIKVFKIVLLCFLFL